MNKKWAEINDDSSGTCNSNSWIKFRTSILKFNFCNYSEAYMLVKGAVTITNTGTADNPNNVGEENT